MMAASNSAVRAVDEFRAEESSAAAQGARPLGAGGSSLDDKLARFRATHPPRELVHDGVTWRYVVGGEGPAVLMLGGALGHADLGFGTMSLLERRFRVLAPSYAPVERLAEAGSALAALLDTEAIGTAHVVGGSFGGVLAQAFARQYPERVASLTLSHTGAPAHARGRGLALGLLRLLPVALLRSLFRRRVRSALDAADPFWLRQFDASVAGFSKADIVSRAALAAEFGNLYGATAKPLRPPYPVLILDSADDPLLGNRHRALRALYPEAELHEFAGTGHIASVLRPDEFAGVLLDFLSRASATTVAGRP